MSVPSKLIERAKVAGILAHAKRYTALTKDSEIWWSGPCPNCGGRDRFAVDTKRNTFRCRGCEARGDTIALVMLASGCGFREAVERLAGEAWRPSSSARASRLPQSKGSQPRAL